MKFLITGCGGFIGSHLADSLVNKGEVFGTIYKNKKNLDHIKEKIKIIKCDVSKKSQVFSLIKKTKPDMIFHLAAQSLVIPSWKNPENTFNSNIIGTYNMLEAAREFCPESKIIVACSSAEYGLTFDNEIPIKENKEFRPSSPYAVSKITTDMLCYMFWLAYKMKIIRVRFFNITGPRKRYDMCSDFSKEIVDVEKNNTSHISVGNLNGLRDITDVRDCVNALNIISEKGVFGEVYNVCSGKSYKVSEILDKLLKLSSKEIEVKEDKSKFRPSDDPLFIGDNTKIKKLGWKPEIKMEKTLNDMLAYWRNEI